MGRLEPEKIVAQALALIDESGLEAFSWRKLAARLEVEPMSLYHYYPSKGHLLDAVADRLIAEVVIPKKGAWQDRVRTTMRRYRKVAHQHPRAFLLMATRRYNHPDSLRFLEGLLGIFRAAGFGPQGAARAFRLLGYFLHGALLSELTVEGRQADPTPSAIDNQDLPEPLPHLREAAPYLGPNHLEATFEAGLEALLASLAESTG